MVASWLAMPCTTTSRCSSCPTPSGASGTRAHTGPSGTCLGAGPRPSRPSRRGSSGSRCRKESTVRSKMPRRPCVATPCTGSSGRKTSGRAGRGQHCWLGRRHSSRTAPPRRRSAICPATGALANVSAAVEAFSMPPLFVQPPPQFLPWATSIRRNVWARLFLFVCWSTGWVGSSAFVGEQE
uniref:Uncharacterized protein n=1 Tax=Ixodes ricinus TaxID=34613 RepID=A0A6B0V0B7_IXORI